jgi:hypothetical protein
LNHPHYTKKQTSGYANTCTRLKGYIFKLKNSKLKSFKLKFKVGFFLQTSTQGTTGTETRLRRLPPGLQLDSRHTGPKQAVNGATLGQCFRALPSTPVHCTLRTAIPGLAMPCPIGQDRDGYPQGDNIYFEININYILSI